MEVACDLDVPSEEELPPLRVTLTVSIRNFIELGFYLPCNVLLLPLDEDLLAFHLFLKVLVVQAPLQGNDLHIVIAPRVHIHLLHPHLLDLPLLLFFLLDSFLVLAQLRILKLGLLQDLRPIPRILLFPLLHTSF